MLTTGDQLRRRSPVEIGIMAAVFLSLLGFIVWLIPENTTPPQTNFCPQPHTIVPEHDFKPTDHIYEDEYREFSLKALQGAVQVPSITYDDMDLDPTQEPRFKVFHKLHDHLASTFPLLWKRVEFVNEYGLLFTIEGSEQSLKPIVLMAHQDVVPVAESSLDLWDYPPFEAHYDGEFLYGRGAADTKNTLVGTLEAAENLLQQKWHPRRTVIISLGFDEEVSGPRGAKPLAQTLLARYGVDGVELVVDEGSGFTEMFGSRVAAVTVSEKGYMDVKVTLHTQGGHSSQPPDHTGIGIISQLVKALETHPFPSELTDANPTLSHFRCLAENSPDMDKALRYKVLRIDEGDHRAEVTDYLLKDPQFKYLIRTTQAADVIEGGVKINALPESTELLVNHRIDVNSGTGAIYDRFEHFAEELGSTYNLGVISRGETLVEPTKDGFFNISATSTLEPAPVSPFFGPQWDLIAGTSQNILRSGPYDIDRPVVIAPALCPANTDTRHYWDLTRAIYRFCPVLAEDIIDFHTVNERLRFRSHLLTVAWYYEFLINSTN